MAPVRPFRALRGIFRICRRAAGAHLLRTRRRAQSRPRGIRLQLPKACDCQGPPRMTRAGMPKREWKPDWKRRTAGKPDRGARPQRTPGQPTSEPDGPVILYGWHPVKAALENPARGIRRLLATENALRRLTEDHVPLRVEPELVRPQAIAQRLSPDALHQGLLVEADPLPAPGLEDIVPAGIVLVLDQITDPHNVGAILRTAAGFAVDAVITTARHSPEA